MTRVPPAAWCISICSLYFVLSRNRRVLWFLHFFLPGKRGDSHTVRHCRRASCKRSCALPAGKTFCCRPFGACEVHNLVQVHNLVRAEHWSIELLNCCKQICRVFATHDGVNCESMYSATVFPGPSPRLCCVTLHKVLLSCFIVTVCVWYSSWNFAVETTFSLFRTILLLNCRDLIFFRTFALHRRNRQSLTSLNLLSHCTTLFIFRSPPK